MRKKLFLALLICCTWLVRFDYSIYAMEDGAYKVSVNTSYYNPDTKEIDDGGTANAALGEGMCRSATYVEGLVEKSGDEYFVTIRLLLQSDTKKVNFYSRTGFDEYEQLTYDIIAENGEEDSIDYRFKVEDPFKSIKATMYVTPMGRETLWYILLDENTLSNDTGDFIVSEDISIISGEEPEIEKQEVMNQDEGNEINMSDSQEVVVNNKNNSNTTIYIVGGIILIGLIIFFTNRVKGDK